MVKWEEYTFITTVKGQKTEDPTPFEDLTVLGEYFNEYKVPRMIGIEVYYSKLNVLGYRAIYQGNRYTQKHLHEDVDESKVMKELILMQDDEYLENIQGKYNSKGITQLTFILNSGQKINVGRVNGANFSFSMKKGVQAAVVAL